MRRSFLAVILVAAAACVDVPDSVRAEFAGPGAADRSNFRPGQHGSAPPAEEPPVEKAAPVAVTGAANDAGASSAAQSPEDGGAAAPEPAAVIADGGAS